MDEKGGLWFWRVFFLHVAEAEGGDEESDGGKGDESEAIGAEVFKFDLVEGDADEWCEQSPESGEADVGAHVEGVLLGRSEFHVSESPGESSAAHGDTGDKSAEEYDGDILLPDADEEEDATEGPDEGDVITDGKDVEGVEETGPDEAGEGGDK